MTGSRERVALASFVAGALLAGGNGVSIRFSNRELAPLWGAGLRFSLAAALLLVVAQGQERLRLTAVIGTLLALVGVAVISQGPLGASVPLGSVLAALASAVCIAQAAVLVRRFPAVHPVTMNAVGMTTGAALLLVGSVLAGEPRPLPQRTTTWAAVGYLVVVGSVVVFVLYLVVLRYWAASRAAYAFVLIPFVTVLLSAWLDNEPLG